MEYTQWGMYGVIMCYVKCSLNPCCNGIYSMSSELPSPRASKWGLNPCCNGIYSMRKRKSQKILQNLVLILVVMEYTQWAGTLRQNGPTTMS